jgi:hypothetical protein
MEFLPDELLELLLLTADWESATRLCMVSHKIENVCNPQFWINKIREIAPGRIFFLQTPIVRLIQIAKTISDSGSGYIFGRTCCPVSMDHPNLLQLPKTFIPNLYIEFPLVIADRPG